MKNWIYLFHFFFGLGFLEAIPVLNGKCSRSKCFQDNAKFSYRVGHSYQYRYEANITSSAGQALQSSSNLFLSSTVYFDILDHCEWMLRLSDVHLEESEVGQNEKKEAAFSEIFRTNLESYPLRFSYHDGLIENVCITNDKEPHWSINIKRGILSAIQNSQKRVDLDHDTIEVDVGGECDYSYIVRLDHERFVNVYKTRNVCSQGKFTSLYNGIPYKMHDTQEPSAYLQRSSECVQSIHSKIFKQVTCQETVALQPTENTAVTAKISQLLSFVDFDENDRDFADLRIIEKMDLRFDAISEDREILSDEEIDEIINGYCLTADEEMDHEDFVLSILERSSEKKIQVIIDGDSCLKDSASEHIYQLSSPSAIAYIRNLFSSGTISAKKMTNWITTLSSLSNPTIRHIIALEPLLESSSVKEELWLAISSLAGKLCRMEEKATKSDEIERLVQRLSKPILKTCRYAGANDEVVLALRSLANAGHCIASSSVFETCLHDSANDLFLRSFSLESLRLASCATPRTDAFSIYKNQSEPAEVRASAFHAVMACPSVQIIQEIIRLLESEDSNQVKSYVLTFLKSVQKSSSPSVLTLQSLIGTKALPADFESNVLKFSRNDELSYYSSDLDIGGQVQGSIMFGGELFLPRTARLNVTADLFGRSYNIYELYMRAEGLESIFREYLFGKVKKTSEVGLYSKWDKEYNLEEIDKAYEKREKTISMPKLTLLTRSFGKEQTFKVIDNPRSFTDVLQNINPLGNINAASIPRNQPLFDESVILPTICGLPLKIKASAKLKIKSQTSTSSDLSQLSQYGKANVKWNLDTRFQLPLTAQMKINLPFVDSGASHTLSLESHVRTEGHLLMNSWNDIDFKFSFPDDTVKLLEMRNEAAIVHYGKIIQTKMPTSPGKSEYTGCVGLKDKWKWGLKLCVDAQPSLSTFVSGSLPRYALYLKKNSVSFKGLRMKHKIARKFGLFHMDSKMTAEYGTDSTTLLALTGKVALKESNGGTEVSANISANYNKREYLVQGNGLLTTEKKDVLISLSSKQENILRLKVVKDDTNMKSLKLSTALSIGDGAVSEYKVDLVNSDKKELVLSITSPNLNAAAKGHLKMGHNSVKGNLGYSYSLYNNKKRFGNIDLRDANPSSIFKKLEIIYTSSDNREMLNKDSFSWYHVWDTTKGYSMSLTGPAYSYRNKLFYRNQVDQESYELSVEAKDEKMDYSYEGKLVVKDYLMNLDSVFIRSKKELFKTRASWETNGASLNREDQVDVESRWHLGNLLTVKAKVVSKLPVGFAVNGTGRIGEEGDFKCEGSFKTTTGNQPKKMESMLKLSGTKFDTISGLLSYINGKVEKSANLELQVGPSNGVDLKFISDVKNMSALANGMIQLFGSTYSTEVMYNYASDQELLVDLHLDGSRDIWLRLYRNGASLVKRQIAEIKWDANRDPTQYAKLSAEQSVRPRGHQKAKIELLTPQNKIGMFWNLTKENSGYKFDFSTKIGKEEDNELTIAVIENKNVMKFNATTSGTHHGFKNSSVLVSLIRTEFTHDLHFHITKDGVEKVKLSSVGVDKKVPGIRNISEQAFLFVPFYREEPLDLTFIFFKNQSGHDCKLNVKLHKEDSNNLTLENRLFVVHDGHNFLVDGIFEIATPLPSLSLFNVKFKHVSSFVRQFKLDSSLSIGLLKDVHELSFSAGIGDDTASYGADMSVLSTLIGPQPVSVSVSLRPSLLLPAIQVQLDIPGSTVVVISRVDRLLDGGYSAVASIAAPFIEGDKLEILGEWNLNEKLVLKAAALLGTGKGFRFEARYFFASLRNFDVGFLVRSPWEDYQNGGFLVQFSADKTLSIMNGTLVGTYNADEYTLGFFKEANEDLNGAKIVKGELLLGLPFVEILKFITFLKYKESEQALTLTAEQAGTFATLTLDVKDVKEDKSFELSFVNSRYILLPYFDSAFSIYTSKEEDGEFEQSNRTASVHFHIKHTDISMANYSTHFDFNLTETSLLNSVGEEGVNLKTYSSIASDFVGIPLVVVELEHDTTTAAVLKDTISWRTKFTNAKFDSNVDFDDQQTYMELRVEDLSSKKTDFYKMSSEYTVSDVISVTGQYTSSIKGYRKVPWNLEYKSTGGSTDSNEDYYGDWGEFQSDQPAEEGEEDAKADDPWSVSVKLGIKLPEMPITSSFFVNDSTISGIIVMRNYDFAHDGNWEANALLTLRLEETGVYIGSANLSYGENRIEASGLVELKDGSSFHKFSGTGLITTWNSAHDLTVSVERDLEGPGYKLINKFTWDDQEIRMNLGYTLSDLSLFGITIEFYSTFEEAEKILFIISHKAAEKIQTTMELDFPRRVAGLIYYRYKDVHYSHESSIESNYLAAKITSKGVINYHPFKPKDPQKLSIESNWDLSSSNMGIEYVLSFATDIANFFANGKGVYSSDDGNTEFNAEIEISEMDQMGIKIDGQFVKDTSDGTVEIKMGDKKTDFSINHDLTSEEKSLRLAMHLPDADKYDTELYFNKEKTDVKIRSTTEVFGDLEGDFELRHNKTGFRVGTVIKSSGDRILSFDATVNENSEGRLKVYQGTVYLESTLEKLEKLKVTYDTKFTDDRNMEHELILQVNKFDESKWKYIKGFQEGPLSSKEEIELEGKYIIWPVAVNYLYIKECPTGKSHISTIKRKVSLFDADEPKLRADLLNYVQTTESGKVYSIEVASVNLTTMYEKKGKIKSHKTVLRLAPDGSKNFGYDVMFNGTSIGDSRTKIILMVPQRSVGLAAVLKTSEKSFGALGEISWDAQQTDGRIFKAYFQADDATISGEKAKKWKLGIKHRLLQEDILLEGSLFRDRLGNLRSTSELRYLPGIGNRLKQNFVFGSSTKYWEFKQNSGFSLSLPKANFEMAFNQSLLLDLKKFSCNISASHSFEDSVYQSSRQLIFSRENDKLMSYKAELPEGNFISEAILKKESGKFYADLKSFFNDKTVNVKSIEYMDLPDQFFKMYSVQNGTVSQEETFELIYKWNDDKTISLSAVSLASDGVTIPIRGHIALNNSHFLTASLNWTPTIYSDVKEYITSYIATKVGDVTQFTVNSVQSSYESIVGDLLPYMEKEIEPVFTPFKEDIESEIDKLVDDSIAIQELFETMYEKNDFLMKTVVGLAKILLEEYPVDEVLREFKDWLAVKQEELTEGITSKSYDFEAWANDLEDQINNLKEVWEESIYNPAIDAMASLRDGLMSAFHDRLETYEKVMNSISQRMTESLTTLAFEVRNAIVGISSTLYEQLKPGFLTALDVVESGVLDLVNKISSFFSYEEAAEDGESFFERMEKLAEKISKTFESFSFEKIKERFDIFLQKLKEGFLNTGNFGRGFSNLIEGFQKLKSSLSYLTSETFEVTGNLDELAANWTDRIRNLYYQSEDLSLMNSNFLEGFSNTATQALIDLREYRTKMVFVPEDGKLLFEQVLPFPWHTLKEGPNILEGKQFELLNLLYFLPKDDIREGTFFSSVLKPMFTLATDKEAATSIYNDSATVILPGNVITFRGSHFDFEPSTGCSYLLFRNFETKNFSLILEKNKKGTKLHESLIFLLGSHKIEFMPGAIKADQTVLVDSKPTILPFISYGAIVSFSSGYLSVKTKDLVVSCHLERKICDISGPASTLAQYGGVLGNIATELETDLLKPNGEKPLKTSSFISSWEISSKCSSKTIPSATLAKDDICASYFDSSISGLANCYGFIQADPFFILCKRKAKREKDAGRCAAIMAYREACRKKGVEISIPQTCLKCETGDRTNFAFNEVKKFTVGKETNVKPVTDILFIFENDECIKEVLKRLQLIIVRIDKELQTTAKTKNNRFGFLIYGSSVESVSFNKAQLFSGKNARDLLHYLKETYPNNELGRESNNTDQLRLAIETFPFRYHSSRTVVFVPCSLCQINDLEEQKGLTSAFTASKLPVHIYFNEEFSFLKLTERKSILGFNSDGGITTKQSGSKKVGSHIQLLQRNAGICADISLKTNGSIFASHRLDDLKGDSAKRSITALARQIAYKTVVQPCQVCKCEESRHLTEAVLVCEPCSQ
ncbi:uncharacterized protein LOC136031509 [Artemia franciscana]|uniref:Vitellogenin domain-containing protein n=1 Tax=Artemia franciscana TaxID=6661 RepID=A0AA88HHA9_ARTSF|nr:hypothetical protein QYM36_017318 [Artemia franciscana]